MRGIRTSAITASELAEIYGISGRYIKAHFGMYWFERLPEEARGELAAYWKAHPEMHIGGRRKGRKDSKPRQFKRTIRIDRTLALLNVLSKKKAA